MNLYEMNLNELTALYNDHVETYLASGCEDYRQHALTVEAVIIEKQNKVEYKTIKVYFEQGYKWSVDVEGEDESRVIGVNKVDAMAIAKQISKDEFSGKATIEAQKLTKSERKENISYLHQNTNTFNINKCL